MSNIILSRNHRLKKSIVKYKGSHSAENIEVAYVGICGSDKQKIRGESNVRFLGHELVGIDKNSGHPIVINSNIPCMKCEMCRRGLYNLCSKETAIGTTVDGGLKGNLSVPNANILSLDKISYTPFVLRTLLWTQNPITRGVSPFFKGR